MPTLNNRRIAERLGRQRAFIETVRDDAEAAALLAGRGYPAARLADGLAVYAAALAAYGGRDAASGARSDAGDSLDAADDDARTRLSDLRATLRALYDGDTGALTTLGVTRSRLAGDRDTFLSESRVTLAAVRKAPYAAAAAGAGQDAKTLDAATDAIAALTTAAQGHGTADGSEEASTSARDAAYAAAQAWTKRFRRFVRLAVKEHPTVAARIGL